MSKTQETLAEMARLTMLTNRLNDIQLKNLRVFPFVFFDGVTQVVLDYDLTNNIDVDSTEDQKELEIQYNAKADAKHMRVTYKLEVSDNADNSDLDKRLEAIEEAVRMLFWKDLKVEVYINGFLTKGGQNE